MRIHRYLIIDNKRGCLLRSWPALCGGGGGVWIFYLLED